MKTTMLLILSIYLVIHVVSGNVPNRPLVSTNLGQVRPKPMLFSPKNLKQKEVVFAYLGIPYARPPVEERRFRPPEPDQPWEDILNATVNPPSCPQVRRPDYEFSEDCLYLNVYVPKTAPDNAAVMVFIHGGSLKTGSGTDYPLNPVPLAALGGVIVVTLNYRLNIFGFFTTGDDAVPPNLGLLDQRRALQWVYENIQAFGGDPQKITLFGESAGAATVGYHILSEDSRQYFQRAILQSGVPLNPWAKILSQEEVGDMIEFIGDIGECGDSVVADCLKAKTLEELLLIVGTIEELFPNDFIFVPSLDGDFFASDIPSLLQNGSYSDIDILLGTNKDEGTYVTFVFTGTPVARPVITKNQFAFITGTTDNPLLTGLLEAIYSDGIDDINNYEGALSSVLGETWFTCGVNDFARQVAAAGSKVYKYRMTHEPMTSIWNTDWLGVTHGEDLQFVFGLPLLDDSTSEGSLLDVKFSFYFIQMWTNFVKSGNPNTPRTLPNGISEWPQFSPDTEIYKELDIYFSNEQRLRQHYCNFWDNLIPQIVYLKEVAVAAGAR